MVMEDPEHCVAQLRDCNNLSAVKRAIQSADEAWTEEFIEHGGLTAILDCLSVLGETAVDSLSDALPRLEVVSCLKAVLNCRYGLECVIRRGGNEGSMVGKIALALNTDNILLKIQIFLVLSAISKHSREGLDATLEALDNYKTELCMRHRYSILVQELSQNAAFPECQATVMVFINYLLSSCDDLQKRLRFRSDLNALDFSDILGIMRYTDNAALLQQVQLYEEGLMRDREEAAMPGGVDITDHQQVFSALFEKVFGTPNAAKLLVILRKMLLIERDTPTGDVIWSGLETMTEAALKIYSEQQAQRVVTSEIVSLRRALEEEAARKARELEERSGDPSSSSTASSNTPATTDSIPAPSVPGPPAPPPPPPPFNPMSKTVAVIRSIFDKAHHYKPTRKMKKINWEKAPDYDAKQSSAVWHGAGEERVKVTVSETHIETLFCQKNEGTDEKLTGKPKKTHLPNQKKALNVNIVLEGMKRDDPTQLSDGSNKTRKKIHMTNEEVLEVIRSGRSSALTLCQVTILWEQAPDDKDASFLEPYMDDKSSQTKLGRVEQFMVGLLATPDHTPRLRVLRTKKIFEDLDTDYRPTFELLHVAMKELMMSRSLKELLHIILLTGNFINGNTKLGSAYGFRISSLQRLSNTLANVRRTSLNVNFLHFLVTVCERDCPRLLKFHTELPHLDDASRVSVEAVEEELGGWRKEVDELEEMKSQSGELQLGKDFISQLDTFLPEANSILSSLLRDLDSVKRNGKELARYFCDDRDDFLEAVFLEIRNFSEEFGKTVKETLKENPIVLTPVGPVSPGNPPHSSPSPSPSPESQSLRPGLSRATSLVTTHILELPSLPLISEECRSSHDPSISPLALSSSGSDLTNPFAFPSNGFVMDDSGSPPIIMVAPPTDVVVTDVENEEEREGEDERSSRTQLKPGKNRSPARATAHRKSSLRGPPLPSLYKRHSVSSIGHPSVSPLSRQSSWNGYKGHSPPVYRRGAGWGPDFNRNPSCPEPYTIFDGSLDEVTKLLHKMAEAIERDMDQK